MGILFAQNSALRIGLETTWGTSQTSTTEDVRIVSSTLQVSQTRERRTHLSVPTSGMLSGTFDGFREAGGTIDLPVMYDGIGMLFKAALGNLSTAAGTPNVHTYTPSFDLPSMTIQFQRGTNLSNSMEKFTGCKVSSMTISVEAGSEMTASFDIISKDAAARGALSPAIALPAHDEVLHFESGQLAFGSSFTQTALDIRSLELTLDNKLDRRNLLGSKLTGEPVPTDVREVTMSVTCDLSDNDVYNDSLAGTADDVSIRFTRTANNTHEFNILLSNANIEDYNDNITAFGRVERTFTIRGFANATNAGLTITIKNANSSGEY